MLPNDAMDSEEIQQLEQRYKPIADSLKDPVAFYQYARTEGLSKLQIFVLLRDLYQQSLVSCCEISEQVEPSAPHTPPRHLGGKWPG